MVPALLVLQFVVACRGKGLDSIGLVDARAAKMQRVNGADPSCPLPLEVGNPGCSCRHLQGAATWYWC